MARDKLVLAYSGGLDTSVAVKWINETYKMDVIAYTCDLGRVRTSRPSVRRRCGPAQSTPSPRMRGSCSSITSSGPRSWPGLFTRVSTHWPRRRASLIAQLMVRVAREHGAVAVAHGCTGKGNDQVRFDVTFQTLAPDLKIVAPVREWKWTRTQELELPRPMALRLRRRRNRSSALIRTCGAARSRRDS